MSTRRDPSYAKVASGEPTVTLKRTQFRNHGTPSWTAPLTMVLAFFAGLVVILAQHFTYSYLNEREVDSISVSQSWISRISTGLAFAIKVALIVCVGTAFVQHQWLRFNQESFTVNEVDTLGSALGNTSRLFVSTVWVSHPLLAFMAIVSW